MDRIMKYSNSLPIQLLALTEMNLEKFSFLMELLKIWEIIYKPPKNAIKSKEYTHLVGKT